MKLYQCKVRLGGSVLNEVPKFNITPAEIMMLRLLHGGDDAVVDIRETGEDRKRSNDGERARLRHAYASAIAKTERGQLDPIMQLFGPDHLPLPTAVKSATRIMDRDEPEAKPAAAPSASKIPPLAGELVEVPSELLA
jgi:hypothetical protein